MSLKLALRNLLRNRWRTGLTIGGIAMACSILIWVVCMQDAFSKLMVRAAIGVEVGHVQVHRQGYIDEPNLFHSFIPDPKRQEALAKLDGVEAISPRVYAFGIIGHENRSSIARIAGVLPRAESVVSTAPSAIQSGRWLGEQPAATPGPRDVVVGATLAKQLQISTEEGKNELVILLQGADGSLGNDLLRVVGVVKTGNEAVDRMTVYMHLHDTQLLAAMEGRIQELSFKLSSRSSPEAVASQIQEILGPLDETEADNKALRARAWQEILPQLGAMMDIMRSQGWVMYFILFFIAALGILNTQRMSALERRREFGVLLAIGVSPQRLGAMMIMETVLVSALGGLAGLIFGGGLTAYHTVAGFDLSSMAKNKGDIEVSFMGINFGDRLFFDPAASDVLMPLFVVSCVGLLCGLWPARWASKLDAVRSIAGRS